MLYFASMGKDAQVMTAEKLIKDCKAGDPTAQKALYEQWGPLLLGVVRRYLSRTEDAEDVFVEGMFKILTKIQTFREEGSFEGWMKRIMVNEALMFLRKQHNFHLVREIEPSDLHETATIEYTLQAEDILKILDQLPDGYRTVFNLYVIEGYKHREIAEILGISINTSKSQLILAKKRMQELLKKNRLTKTG
ncbi:MAG TPA: sigma-70 family RNA polymerase sigma factor [Saprospiraceae bacterium]|nr:sigma-70 family RNA polymerase sigma factor [Saprospiraceae bacterium]